MECCCSSKQINDMWESLKQKCEAKNTQLMNREQYLQNKIDGFQAVFGNNKCSCNNVSNEDSVSLMSADIDYMRKITDLFDKEKQMKKEVENLERREQSYKDVLKDFEALTQKQGSNSDKDNDLRMQFDKMNRELKNENKQLKNDLEDMRLELKQCLERIEGPMQHQLQREQFKCRKLEEQLKMASESMMTSQDCFLREMNAMKMHLTTACSNMQELSTMNNKLKRDLCALDCKCAELEDDLVKQKIKEAETITQLSRSLGRQACQCTNVQQQEVGKGDECGDLYSVARKLSESLKKSAPCEECAQFPPALMDTARGLKGIADMMGKKKSPTKMKDCICIPEKKDCTCQSNVVESSACQCDEAITCNANTCIEGKKSAIVETEPADTKDSEAGESAQKESDNKPVEDTNVVEESQPPTNEVEESQRPDESAREAMTDGGVTDIGFAVKSESSVQASGKESHISTQLQVSCGKPPEEVTEKASMKSSKSKNSTKASSKTSSKASSKISEESSSKVFSKSSSKVSVGESEEGSTTLVAKTSSKSKISDSKSGVSSKSSATATSKSDTSIKASSKASSKSSRSRYSRSSKSRSKSSISEPTSEVSTPKSERSIPRGFEIAHGVVANDKDVLRVRSSTSVKSLGKETVEPPFDIETKVDIIDRPPDGLHVVTTITASGTLEVVTEGPTGVIETTLTYTESGKIEVLTEYTNYEDVKDIQIMPEPIKLTEIIPELEGSSQETPQDDRLPIESKPSGGSDMTEVTVKTSTTVSTVPSVATKASGKSAMSSRTGSEISEAKSKSVNISENVSVYTEGGEAESRVDTKVSTETHSEKSNLIKEDVSEPFPKQDVVMEKRSELPDEDKETSDAIPTTEKEANVEFISQTTLTAKQATQQSSSQIPTERTEQAPLKIAEESIEKPSWHEDPGESHQPNQLQTEPIEIGNQQPENEANAPSSDGKYDGNMQKSDEDKASRKTDDGIEKLSSVVFDAMSKANESVIQVLVEANKSVTDALDKANKEVESALIKAVQQQKVNELGPIAEEPQTDETDKSPIEDKSMEATVPGVQEDATVMPVIEIMSSTMVSVKKDEISEKEGGGETTEILHEIATEQVITEQTERKSPVSSRSKLSLKTSVTSRDKSPSVKGEDSDQTSKEVDQLVQTSKKSDQSENYDGSDKLSSKKSDKSILKKPSVQSKENMTPMSIVPDDVEKVEEKITVSSSLKQDVTTDETTELTEMDVGQQQEDDEDIGIKSPAVDAATTNATGEVSNEPDKDKGHETPMLDTIQNEAIIDAVEGPTLDQKKELQDHLTLGEYDAKPGTILRIVEDSPLQGSLKEIIESKPNDDDVDVLYRKEIGATGEEDSRQNSRKSSIDKAKDDSSRGRRSSSDRRSSKDAQSTKDSGKLKGSRSEEQQKKISDNETRPSSEPKDESSKRKTSKDVQCDCIDLCKCEVCTPEAKQKQGNNRPETDRPEDCTCTATCTCMKCLGTVSKDKTLEGSHLPGCTCADCLCDPCKHESHLAVHPVTCRCYICRCVPVCKDPKRENKRNFHPKGCNCQECHCIDTKQNFDIDEEKMRVTCDGTFEDVMSGINDTKRRGQNPKHGANCECVDCLFENYGRKEGMEDIVGNVAALQASAPPRKAKIQQETYETDMKEALQQPDESEQSAGEMNQVPPCDCQICECEDCSDVSKTKQHPDKIKGHPAECDCSECKCDPCQDPSKQGVGHHSPDCDCLECKCDPCGIESTKQNIIKEDTDRKDVNTHSFDCQCLECSCDSCLDKSKTVSNVPHPPNCDCYICKCELSKEDTVVHMNENEIIPRQLNIEKETKGRKEEVNEIRNVLNQIRCACVEAEIQAIKRDPYVKNASNFETTLSGLQVALDNLRDKCKTKDLLIEVMTKELSNRAGSHIFQCMLQSMAQRKDSPDFDFGRTDVCRILSQPLVDCLENTTTLPQNGESQKTINNLSPKNNLHPIIENQETKAEECTCDKDADVSDMEIMEIRRITHDSILIKWTKPKSDLVTGFHILVDGVVASKVLSGNRTNSIIHSLNLNSTIHIELYAITKIGRCKPPALAIYKINEK